MQITLAQGNVMFAGTDGPPPDMLHLGPQGHISNHDALSSDSSDSPSERLSRHERKREERRERKVQQQERKRERKELKEGQKAQQHERWRLIVSYRAPIL